MIQGEKNPFLSHLLLKKYWIDVLSRALWFTIVRQDKAPSTEVPVGRSIGIARLWQLQ